MRIAALVDATPSDPRWTVMAAFPDRLAPTSDVLKTNSRVSWAVRNPAKPGRTGSDAWVVQASSQWSPERLENDPAAVASGLLALFFKAAAHPATSPIHLAAHRWRYARSGRAGHEVLWDEHLRLGDCGDWLIGPRVENAWLSGRRLAQALLGKI